MRTFTDNTTLPSPTGVTLTHSQACGAAVHSFKLAGRVDSPSFERFRGTSDVLNFVAKCEIFLVFQLLANAELTGTVSRLLKGPAHYWTEFKEAFYKAFLP